MNAFFDTNIFVYSVSKAPTDKRKREHSPAQRFECLNFPVCSQRLTSFLRHLRFIIVTAFPTGMPQSSPLRKNSTATRSTPRISTMVKSTEPSA
jgi:hypothetical protein